MKVKQVSNPHVVATRRTVTWMWSVSVGGGPHQVQAYRVRVRDCSTAELVGLVEQVGRELDARVSARWAELEECDTLPF